MKLAALIMTVFIPTISMAHDSHSDSSVLASSSVTLAAVASLELFESAAKGELYAFQAHAEMDEVGTQILYANNGHLRLTKYDCHFHAHGDAQEAHCHDVIDESSALPVPAALAFNTDSLLEALTHAVDIFARKVATPDSLNAVKMWQAQNEMFVNLTYTKNSQEAVAYFMCHLHGAHIDCHRSLKPGPQEPQL